MALTQEALYAELDLALSWSERDLPERERTILILPILGNGLEEYERIP